MIRYWKKDGAALVAVDAPGRDVWVDVRDVSRDDLDALEKDYGVLPEHLQDMLDVDERSRIEKEDAYTMLILRLPIYDARYEVIYFTVPVGVILFKDRVVTVCASDCEVLQELSSGKVRDLSIANKSAFVLRLMGRAAIVYLRYLKDLNRRTSAIELELQRSVKNNELIKLLAIEKSLVFFTTSLRSDEMVLEKLQKGVAVRFKEDETELLEDVATDFRQAIEMSNIHSDILSGMMDAFASVISNNLNIVMKRLTIVSIVLMIPTFVVSVFGMNVPLPAALTGSPFSFAAIMGACGVSAAVGAFLLRDRRHRPKKPLLAPAAGALVLPPAKR
ncbi:MAG: magnesium transporter CorA family protein [Spirochaetes bacterium]|nr:magnesium transporter CorA family protein [Spirochaetota bacterium]MBU1081061.1 magnesium transporter CorA family protein [Spirochaetota bacterium]